MYITLVMDRIIEPFRLEKTFKIESNCMSRVGQVEPFRVKLLQSLKEKVKPDLPSSCRTNPFLSNKIS